MCLHQVAVFASIITFLLSFSTFLWINQLSIDFLLTESVGLHWRKEGPYSTSRKAIVVGQSTKGDRERTAIVIWNQELAFCSRKWGWEAVRWRTTGWGDVACVYEVLCSVAVGHHQLALWAEVVSWLANVVSGKVEVSIGCFNPMEFWCLLVSKKVPNHAVMSNHRMVLTPVPVEMQNNE